MIKQFNIQIAASGRDEVQQAIASTLLALGYIEPRVLVTRVFDREYNVTVATDEELTSTV